jgi:hypothetical protein
MCRETSRRSWDGWYRRSPEERRARYIFRTIGIEAHY